MARILLGRRRAHYHAWLPTLRIEGRSAGQPGRILYRGRRLLALSGSDLLERRARGKVLIVGSGPSAGGLMPEALSPRSALLLNGAISLIGKGLAEPLAVAIEDERFIWRHFDLLARMVTPDIPMLLSPGVIRTLCDIAPDFIGGRPVILIDDIRKPYGRPRRDEAELAALDHVSLRGQAGFSTDPDLGVFHGGSVVVTAAQFALATAAKEIGFIGVDIANADQPRFYEAAGDAAFSGVAAAERRILDHLALAAEIAKRRGVTFVNHSAVSALRSIGLAYVPLDASVA